MRDSLPPEVSLLSMEMQRIANSRFLSLASEREAPVARYPKQSIWWPTTLPSRALPEGIMPRTTEDGFSDLCRLTRFFRKYSGGKVFIGDLGSFTPYFRYAGYYGADLCAWIKNSLISNPTCLLACEDQLLLIADEQLRYSVIGGSTSVIAVLESEWGGPEELRSCFVEYVENGELGFDSADREWAYKYLISWSGW